MPSGKVIIASDVTFVENKDPRGTTPDRGEEPVEPDILKEDVGLPEQDESDEPQDSDDEGENEEDEDPGGPGPGQAAQGAGIQAQARYPSRARARPGAWWR